jgi:hypothetical protein
VDEALSVDPSMSALYEYDSLQKSSAAVLGLAGSPTPGVVDTLLDADLPPVLFRAVAVPDDGVRSTALMSLLALFKWVSDGSHHTPPTLPPALLFL